MVSEIISGGSDHTLYNNNDNDMQFNLKVLHSPHTHLNSVDNLGCIPQAPKAIRGKGIKIIRAWDLLIPQITLPTILLLVITTWFILTELKYPVTTGRLPFWRISIFSHQIIIYIFFKSTNSQVTILKNRSPT